MRQEEYQEEYIMPVPDTIEIHHKDRRKMDHYVAEFPATNHGYRMRIGNSQKKSSAVSHYECYRSGHPPKVKGTTKSARIGCPFKMDTRFLYHSSSWILIHTHIGHNHPPDPNVKPRKRHIDPNAGPILAPGVVLDANIKTTTHQTANVTSNKKLTSETFTFNSLLKKPASTPEGSICRLINHPEPHVEIQTLITTTTTESLKPKQNFELPDANAWLPETLHVTTATPLYYDLKADLKTLETLDSTISKLRGKLCAMAPHRRQAVLMKIQLIISNERMVNDEHKLPMSFLPEPPEPNLLYNSVNETPMSPYISPVPAHREELSVESLIEDFCGPSKATTPTFNFEDLIISQPSLDDANNRLEPKLLLPTSPPTTTLEN
ncbi:uncharacterized protein MELLADRAFT_84500 [Melampsora larici-populina 98AG31]|uniref:Uncharacterized protein n=1 Tax=Melampsora larici-populina (strain 98AG31 / pathotype 3-4-7) TaxID=747676 RepID=F4SC87_MELLP|nr:uncharacterized protein MELLADRAFT_84500 [Melampsora larici-populina 98AG31]EGF97745.1 hypothetical protein MELLADRAFT_84500 [Melampsora larici-populina 98AG31]